MRGKNTTIATIALVAGLALGSTTSGFAHNQVVRTTPADGEEWTESPVTLEVETLENLLDLGGNSAGFALVVLDEEGLFYGDGCVEVSGNVLRASADLGAPGVYEVVYQFVSEDGHTISDRYHFTFSPSPDHIPATGLATAPVCGEPTGDSNGNAEAEPTADQGGSDGEAQTPPLGDSQPREDSTGFGGLIAGAVGVVFVAASIGWLLARRRQAN